MLNKAIHWFVFCASIFFCLASFGLQAQEEALAEPVTWDSLNNEVMSLFGAGRYEAALIPAQRALQLARDAQGQPHLDTALALNNLAGLHDRLGDYTKAERLYKEALAIKEQLLGPDDQDVALGLNNLAALYKTQARYTEAEQLYLRALAIWERALGPDAPVLATGLNNLAVLYETQGRSKQAEPLYLRSLAIRERVLGSEHPDVALALNNLAAFYYHQGNWAQAESLYQRALAIREQRLGPEHPDVALSLNNLAVLYRSQGDYARAEPLYRRALAIDERRFGSHHPEVATDLNNLAVLYDHLGDAAKAEPLYQRSLAILEQALGPEHPQLAEGLNNLALLHKTQGDYAKAMPLYERALAILKTAFGPEHLSVATALNNLAALYDSQGQHAKAQPLFEQVLRLREEALGPGHLLVGVSLNNLAELYRAKGELAKAEPLYLRASWIGIHVGAWQFEADVLDNLSRFVAVQAQPDAAIFLGKLAVKALQGLRANVAELGQASLKGYDATIEDVYRHLARLLVARGRLAEAGQVLALFKAQEQFEFLRRDTGLDLLSDSLSMTPLEAEQARKLLAAEGEAAFVQAFAEALQAFRASEYEGQQPEVAETQALQDRLRQLVQASGEQVAALYTIADVEEYGLILVTAEGRQAWRVPLKPHELSRRISIFRQLLQNRDYDARAEAQALLDIVLPPKARDALAKAGITTLMWHLDGPLRLLPLAALHDGSGYLIERYRISSFMATSLSDLEKPHDALDWKGLGFGVSKDRQVGDKTFSALPAVPEELGLVIQAQPDQSDQSGQVETKGIIPGQRYLNADFDWPRLKQALQPRNHSLLHIASHFNLEPGNDTQSYLLTGEGAPISLAMLNGQHRLFDGLELLTLSACNTALDTGKNAQGREVDGLAFIVQRQGARSVVATLWPVADEATAKLMEHFYQRLKDKKLSKTEALRQAQLALLNPGKVQGQQQDGPYAHPFYWAPFVLMGDWR
jgi:CHAT domain-containing protein/tetratricopeptide (TPR) repeat protein